MFKRILFFGTPVFAAKVLEFLLDRQVPICAVVTQPDRPRGRGLSFSPSPVKEVAIARGIETILQPEKASHPPFLEAVQALSPEISVVVAFGQILPQRLLDIPPYGSINVHASLLPKLRGAAPIQRAILHGETETGVCVQKMVKAMDAGDVLAEEKVSILPDMDAGALEKELLERAGPLLLHTLANFSSLLPCAKAQDPEKVTFAPKILPEQGEIYWVSSAEAIDRLIRGFSPKPGAWTEKETGGRIKVLKARPVLQKVEGSPGEVVSRGAKEPPLVVCGEGAMELLLVQPEGKRAMEGAEWARGLSLPFRFKPGRGLGHGHD